MLSRQIKAGRSLLGWSREQMAAISGVPVPTICKLESADIGSKSWVGACAKLVGALEAAGVELLHQGGAGVRLRDARLHEIRSTGPATDVVAEMDAAIDDDRSGRNVRSGQAGRNGGNR